MKNKTRTKIFPEKMDSFNDGWTFIETLIVMSIVMVLTASVGVSAVKQIDKARMTSAKSQVEVLCSALDSLYLDTGNYPDEEYGLEMLWTNCSGAEDWNGPYISKKIPKDPWGNDFVYTKPGPDGLPYAIVCLGKDGIAGGTYIDGDITSY